MHSCASRFEVHVLHSYPLYSALHVHHTVHEPRPFPACVGMHAVQTLLVTGDNHGLSMGQLNLKINHWKNYYIQSCSRIDEGRTCVDLATCSEPTCPGYPVSTPAATACFLGVENAMTTLY